MTDGKSECLIQFSSQCCKLLEWTAISSATHNSSSLTIQAFRECQRRFILSRQNITLAFSAYLADTRLTSLTTEAVLYCNARRAPGILPNLFLTLATRIQLALEIRNPRSLFTEGDNHLGIRLVQHQTLGPPSEDPK
jgi:hypothetical protein